MRIRTELQAVKDSDLTRLRHQVGKEDHHSARQVLFKEDGARDARQDTPKEEGTRARQERTQEDGARARDEEAKEDGARARLSKKGKAKVDSGLSLRIMEDPRGRRRWSS